MKNFSQLAEPLTQLLGDSPADKMLLKTLASDKKDLVVVGKVKTRKQLCRESTKRKNAQWHWGEEQSKAFDILKYACKLLVLLIWSKYY